MVDDSSARIAAELREWIGQAAPGARLPSSRALATRFGAGPVTVQKAMHALAAAGLTESRPGVGTFVRSAREARPPDYGWQTAALRGPRAPALMSTLRIGAPDSIGLHSGYPDRSLLPEQLVRRALGRAARGEKAVTRSPAAGLPELRAWFAAELAAGAPAGVTPPSQRDVVIVPGSQSGLSSVFRTLVGAGRPLLVESPTYVGALLAAARAGAHLVPVPTGPDGPEPGDVARAFAESGARAFYAQPTFANPTGALWSDERRREVLDVVRAHGAFLVEDDWACDFGIAPVPAPIAAHDDAGHVVRLRSLTKSVSPSVRVAAVIARGPARDRILADRSAESIYVSEVLQAAALDVVTQPGWLGHLRTLGPRLRERRDLLATSVAEHVPDVRVQRIPRGGLHLWVRLPDGADPDRLSRDCEAAGVLIAPGDEWFPAEPPGPFVRLNFCGPDPDRYPDAARVIAQALARGTWNSDDSSRTS